MAAGVPTAGIVGQGRWYVSGHLLARSQTDMVGLGVSRPLLEAELRARVRALPNLVIRTAAMSLHRRLPRMAASSASACSAAPTGAPPRCWLRTWWSTRPAVAPGPPRGSTH